MPFPIEPVVSGRTRSKAQVAKLRVASGPPASMQLTSALTCNVVAITGSKTFARCAISPTPVISSRRRFQRGRRSWRIRLQAEGSQEAAQAVAEQGQGPSNPGNGAALSLSHVLLADQY